MMPLKAEIFQDGPEEEAGDSKYKKDVTCHCWLEVGGGHESRNTGGILELRVAPTDSKETDISLPTARNDCIKKKYD